MVIGGVSDLYNYTQIFEDVIHLSGTQRNSMIRGDETQAELVSRKQKELMAVLQSTLILGQRNKNVGDKRYSMGGLKYMIDTYAPDNKVDFGGSWASDATVLGKFEDAIELIANNNGQKPTIYMGYKAMRKFRMINDDLIKTDRTDKGRGIGVVTNYLSQLGQLDVVLLNDPVGVFSDMIFFLDESKVGYKAMKNRGWFTEELAKVGDSYKWQVLGEYTFKIETPKIATYLYNLGL